MSIIYTSSCPALLSLAYIHTYIHHAFYFAAIATRHHAGTRTSPWQEWRRQLTSLNTTTVPEQAHTYLRTSISKAFPSKKHRGLDNRSRIKWMGNLTRWTLTVTLTTTAPQTVKTLSWKTMSRFVECNANITHLYLIFDELGRLLSIDRIRHYQACSATESRAVLQMLRAWSHVWNLSFLPPLKALRFELAHVLRSGVGFTLLCTNQLLLLLAGNDNSLFTQDGSWYKPLVY